MVDERIRQTAQHFTLLVATNSQMVDKRMRLPAQNSTAGRRWLRQMGYGKVRFPLLTKALLAFPRLSGLDAGIRFHVQADDGGSSAILFQHLLNSQGQHL